MKGFQSIIQNYLKNHEKHKKWLAAVLVLSILVTGAVQLGLMTPAISMTDDNNVISSTMYDGSVQRLAAARSGKGAQQGSGPWHRWTWDEIKNGGSGSSGSAADGIVVNNGNDTVTGVSASGFTVGALQASGNISINYELDYGVNISHDNPTIKIEMSANVIVPDELMKDSFVGYITDNNYANQNRGAKSGEYVFVKDEETGKHYIVITYYDDYLNYVNQDEGSRHIDADLTFDAEFDNAQWEDGFETIIIGDMRYDVGRQYDLSVNKVKNYNKDEKKVVYTVDAYSQYGSSANSDTTITVHDDLNDSDGWLTPNDDVKIICYTLDKDGNRIEETEVSGYNLTRENEDFTITGLPRLDLRQGYEITYSAQVNQEKLAENPNISQVDNISNSVSVRSDDDVSSGSATNNNPLYLRAGVIKSGRIVEENGKKMIRWEVTVKNPLKSSVEGFTLTDDLWQDGSNDVFSGAKLSRDYEGITIEGADTDTLILHDTNAGETSPDNIIIYYYTDIPDEFKYNGENNTIPNRVTLKTEDNEIPYEASVDYQTSYSIQKSGTADLSKGEIEWVLTINNPDRWDLGGFTVTDVMSTNGGEKTPAFSGSDFIGITEGYDKIGQPNGDSFTIENGVTDNPLIVKYKTKIPEDAIYSTDATVINNEASLKKDDVPFGSDDHDITVKPTYSIDKVGEAQYADGKIKWTIVVNNPDGLDLNGFDINDLMLGNASNIKVETADQTVYVNRNSGSQTPETPTENNPVSGAVEGFRIEGNNANSKTFKLYDSKPIETVKITLDTASCTGWQNFNFEIRNNGQSVEKATVQYDPNSSSLTLQNGSGSHVKVNGNVLTFDFSDSGITADEFYCVKSESWSELNVSRLEFNYVGGNNFGGGSSEVPDDTTDHGNGTVNLNGVNLTQLNSGYSINGGKLNFTESVKSKSVIITYETEVSGDDKYKDKFISNVSELEKGDKPVDESKATVKWTPNYKIHKNDAVSESNGSGGFIYNWSITFESESGASIKDFVLTDDYNGNNAIFNDVSATIKITDGSGNLLTAGSDYTLNSDGTITINKDISKAVVTYQTEVAAENIANGETVVNTAGYIGPGDVNGSDSGIGSHDAGFDLDKQITSRGKISDASDYQFSWKITVRNDKSLSLKDYYLTDDVFSNADVLFTVAKTDGTALVKDIDYKIVGDKLTFLTDINSEVDITYQTTVNTIPDDNGNHSILSDYEDINNVKFYPPGGTDKPVEDTETAKYSPSYSVDKAVAKYDSINEVIEWKITVNNSNYMSLDGFTVSDTYFTKAKNGIKLTSGSTQLNSGEHYTYDESSGTVTFKEISYHPIVISYETDVADCTITDNKIINKVTLEKDDKIWEDTAEQTITARDELNKSSVSNEVVSNGTKRMIPWEVTIGRSKGGLKGLSYTDTIAEADNGCMHFMTGAQAKDVELSYQADDKAWNSLSGDAYSFVWMDKQGNMIGTLEDDSEIYSFKITFTDSEVLDNVSDVKLKYFTTGDIEKAPADTMVTFKNCIKRDFDDDAPPKEAVFQVSKVRAYQKFDGNNWDVFHSYNYKGTDSQAYPNGYNAAEEQTYLDSELDKDSDGNYLIKWHIKVNGNVYGENEDITLVDILPEGMSLASGQYTVNTWEYVEYKDQWGNTQYKWQISGSSPIDVGFAFTNPDMHPSAQQIYENYENTGTDSLFYNKYFVDYSSWGGDYGYSYDPDSNKVTFKIPGSVHKGQEFYIDYAAKITPEDLEKLFEASKASGGAVGKAVFENTLTGSYGDESHTINVDESIVGKDVYKADASANSVYYTLDINPKAETLNKGQPLTLVDTLYSDSAYIGHYDDQQQSNGDGRYVNWWDKGGFAADLTYLVVYAVDESGNETKISNYIVSVEYDPTLATNDTLYAAKLTLQVPDGVHLKVEYTYHIARSYADEYYNDGINIFNTLKIQSILSTQDTTKNGTYFLNESTNATSSTGGANGLSIKKVDENTYEGLSNAEFDLYAYHEQNGGWLKYVGYTSSKTNDATIYNEYYQSEDGTQIFLAKETIKTVNGNAQSSWEWSSTASIPGNIKGASLKSNASGKIDLQDIPEGIIMKAVETKQPSGYMLNTEPTYFYFGSNKGSVGGFPNGLSSNSNNTTDPPLWNLILGQSLAVENTKINTSEIPVSKVWADEAAETHTGDSVTVGLYRSYTAPADSSGGSESSSGISGTVQGNSNTYKYNYDPTSGLLTIDVSGVSESQKYELQKTNLPSDINNLDWANASFKVYDSGGTEISGITTWGTGNTSSYSSCGFNVVNGSTYSKFTIQFSGSGSETGGDNDSPYDNSGIPKDAVAVQKDGADYTIVLNQANGWSGIFTDIIDKDASGEIYYYVKEISYVHGGVETSASDSDAHYIPSYTGNGTSYDSLDSNFGDITVTNSPLIDLTVTKVWKDFDGNTETSNNTEVTFTLKRYTKDDKSDEEAVKYNDLTSFTTSNKTYSFTNLPPANASGQLYHYYVAENEIPGYGAEYSSSDIIASGNITITNEPRKGSVAVQKLWQYNDSDELSNAGPSGSSITVELYRSTQAPPGRYAHNVDELKYGNNSITLPIDTWTDLSNAEITKITVKADTSLFSAECAKTVDILGQTIDISSGTGSAAASGKLTSPLSIKSDSASAVKSIIIDFNGGERVTITNTNPVMAEKPAGEVIYQTWGDGEVNVEIPSSYASYGKDITKIEYNVTNINPGYFGAWVYAVGGTSSSGWNTSYTKTSTDDGGIFTYTKAQINATDVNAISKVGWSGDAGVTSVVIYFTDSTTLTIINGTAPNAASLKSAVRRLTNAVKALVEEAEEADPTDGIPADAVKVGEQIVLNGSETKPWYAQWNDLPYADSDGNPYYYYVKEVNSGGYTFVGYDSNGQLAVDQPEDIEIHNASNEQPVIANLTVNKIWRDGLAAEADRPGVEVKLYQSTNENETNFTEANLVAGSDVTLNKENGWTHTWTELPRWSDEERTFPYYYFAVETDPGESYTVSYTDNGRFNAGGSTSGSIDITNSKAGSITVDKSWVGGVPSGTDSIELEVYRMSENASAVDKTDELRVLAMGDSITDTYNSQYSYRKKFYEDMQKYGFTNLKMVSGSGVGDYSYHEGHSQWCIKAGYNTGHPNGLLGNLDLGNIINTGKPNLILLQIGTNDVLDNRDVSVMKADLTELIEELYKECENRNLDTTIFIASLPGLDTRDEVGGWLGNYGYGLTQTQKQDLVDTKISEYKTAIKAVIAEQQAKGRKCQFSDINSLFPSSKYDEYLSTTDGCHPSDAGYTAMGEYWAKLVSEYLSAAPVDLKTAPPDSAVLAKDVGNNGVITLNKSEGWKQTYNVPLLDENGKRYIYYVKEKTNLANYTTAYDGNGKIADGQTIQVINTKEAGKTSIEAEKIWNDGNASHPEIEVTLKRRLESDSKYDPDFAETVKLNSENGWKYKWSELAADKDGVEYIYSIEENVSPSGYVASYENNNINSGKITITNTKIIGIQLEKIWADDKDHTADTVQVEIHRSVNLADVPKDVELIVTTAGKTTTAVTTTTTTTMKTTTAKTTSVTTTTTESVQTIALPIALGNLNEGDVITVKLKGPANKDVNGSVGGNPVAGGDWSNQSWSGRFDGNGDLTIMVTSDMARNNAQFQVWWLADAPNNGGDTSAVSALSYEIKKAKITTAVTTVTTTTTTTTTKPSGEDPKPGGDTVKVDGFTLNDGNPQSKEITLDSSKNIQSITIDIARFVYIYGNAGVVVLNVNDSSWSWKALVEYNTANDEAEITSENIASAIFENGKLTLNFNAGTSSSAMNLIVYNHTVEISGMEITYASSANYSLRKSASPKLMSIGSSENDGIVLMAAQDASDTYEFDANGVMTKLIKLKNSDGSNWTYTVDNLPAYDENGDQYYYWAVEKPVQGYTPSYSFEDGDSNTQTCISASKPGNGIITIMNTANESPSVLMPATGGSGTKWYYVTGFTIMLTAIAAYYLTKRYRRTEK